VIFLLFFYFFVIRCTRFFTPRVRTTKSFRETTWIKLYLHLK